VLLLQAVGATPGTAQLLGQLLPLVQVRCLPQKAARSHGTANRCKTLRLKAFLCCRSSRLLLLLLLLLPACVLICCR
jgi:hypothetical protein